MIVNLQILNISHQQIIQEQFLLIPGESQLNMSNKYNNQDEGQQMYQIAASDKNPQIVTEIFDPSLPSDLNFEQVNKKELEGVQINSEYKYVKGKSKINITDEIKNFTIKGKSSFNSEPKYKFASIIKQHINTFEVKAFDQEKSGGLKSFWETVVGYIKRQICIQNGYIYIFEKTKEGYLTHSALRLTDLFKMFADPEESKIRLVFHFSKQNIKYKNFQVKSCQQFVQKIAEQASKIGLEVISS